MKIRRILKSSLSAVLSLLLAFSVMVTVPRGDIPMLTADAASNESQIYDYLKGTMGLNTAIACGILANIEKESGFRTGAIGDSGTSYGICQWHKGRFTRLKNWCADNGYDYTTLTGQLHYLQYELETYEKTAYNKVKSQPNTAAGAYQAGYNWCYYFERPANKADKSVTRGNLAKNKYWEKYKDTLDPDPDEMQTDPIAEGVYFIKNSSTGTYINASTASNGAAVSLGAKKDTNAFKMKIGGMYKGGYYITPSISTKYVLNPYADTPSDGNKITLWEKNTDGHQNWIFKKSGSGYILHCAYNTDLVLTANGTGIQLKKETGKAEQVWLIEDLMTYETIKEDTYYIKNSSTGTYINSSSPSNGGEVLLSENKKSNAFKMKIGGMNMGGYYITPSISNDYVLNPWTNSPSDGDKITMYKKNTDGHQN